MKTNVQTSFTINEQPCDRKLLSYIETDAREIIYNGQYLKGCMAKYWYTYYTNVSDNTILTTAHLDEFMRLIRNNTINYKNIDMNFNRNCSKLRDYIKNYA